MSDKKHDFSMFSTTELHHTVEKHERMLNSLDDSNVPLVQNWLDQAKQELTMHPKTGSPVNQIHYVKIVGNTGPRKKLRVWMVLWGVPIQ